MQANLAISSSSAAGAGAIATTTTTTTPPPHLIHDIHGLLRIFSDGSIVRSDLTLDFPVHDDGSVVWKDVLFEASHHLHLRLYKPSLPAPDNSPKLPVLFYLHGGGFCIGSRAWPHHHNYCLRLANDLRAIVVAPDYRLSPEHRLPAAIEDGASAVKWFQSQATSPEPDAWLAEAADFGRVFVSGDSSGGNIVHHLAVRFDAINGGDDLTPLRVRGYVLLEPFFGGTQVTKSELGGPTKSRLTLEACDRFWHLSLPRGADRDHRLSNPFGSSSPSLEPATLEPILVVVAGLDPLRDRGVEYAERLKGWGKRVELVEFEEKDHGFITLDPWCEPANELMRVIKRFMDKNGGESH